MSYILDALRKADAERERGSVPGLHAQPLAAALPSGAVSRIGGDLSDSTRRWLLAGAAATLALLLAVALARLLTPLSDAGSAPQDAPPGPTFSQSPADTPPPGDAGPVAAPQPPGSPAGPQDRWTTAPAGVEPLSHTDPKAGKRTAVPPPSLVATSPAATSPATTPLAAPSAYPLTPAGPRGYRPASPVPTELQTAAAAPARAAAASAGLSRVPAPVASVTGGPGRAATTDGTAPIAGTSRPATLPPPIADAAATPSPADNNRIYQARELPEDVRRELPVLTVGGATYSENAASRMLIINGQVFHENDKLAPDLVLERIQLRSAVLRYKGLRYGIAY